MGTQTVFIQLMHSVQFFLIDTSGYGSIPLFLDCILQVLDVKCR